ncbi:MAG TPA: glyoxylate/hydroxypyruvate reductase A [Aestuariivirgaceae bacterium]|nr:glyoxylate/hydroxypyruvate reductase A [Aestuariivirgaceae bacterium]
MGKEAIEPNSSRSPASDDRLGALLFYSRFDDPKEWEAALKSHLPSLDFRVYPEVGDPADIKYALVWKPFPGFFQDLRNISLVVNLGAGIDSIAGRTDLPSVPVSRLCDSGMVALMKSYVLFAAIRYARTIPEFEAAKRRGEWQYIHPRALSKIKIGVVGLGKLGSAVASALAELGFDTRGWDFMPKSIAGVKSSSDPTDWESFLSEIEILVNMLPLTPKTRNMIDAGVFRSLRRGAKFINASRGEVVDEDALVDALRSGHLGGATLDAFATEPLPAGHPLWTMENVLITPHLASITIPEAAAADVAESIRRVARGDDPLNKVELERGF